MSQPMLVCHGGAGHGAKDQPGVELAADAGWDILAGGGSALEAVIAAVLVMEDDPRLNAGTGGRLRDDGSVQLDAAIATSDGRLGCVMCVENTPNPILVASALLDEQVHILAGDGARTWADTAGIARGEVAGSARPVATDTVGAVARDGKGEFAVASSTGGCTGRPSGRVGDTPIWGAGLWCDENLAVAATGIGEDIILKMLSHNVAIHHQVLVESPVSEDVLAASLAHGIGLFNAETQVGLIAIDEKDGCSLANTDMPWACRP
jgi:isoaspartyl peptidase/L-asparaginase-like protein (Ntn-hydrolase superfamily)